MNPTIDRCEIATAFGRPVVPLVNSSRAMSSSDTAAGPNVVPGCSRSSCGGSSSRLIAGMSTSDALALSSLGLSPSPRTGSTRVAACRNSSAVHHPFMAQGIAPRLAMAQKHTSQSHRFRGEDRDPVVFPDAEAGAQRARQRVHHPQVFGEREPLLAVDHIRAFAESAAVFEDLPE
jgi:hypothetical protein